MNVERKKNKGAMPAKHSFNLFSYITTKIVICMGANYGQ